MIRPKIMLRHAIVRPPSGNFADGLTSAGLGPPDVALALEQHSRYCEALERRGLTVRRLPPDPRFPDSTFVEDTAVLTERGAILTRPGAPSRRGEVAGIRAAVTERFPRPAEIRTPGTVEGGDVCDAGDRFFIGVSERTNEEGARQLAAWLGERGYGASCIDIRGMPGVLHLKSGLAFLGDQRLVAIDELASHAALRHGEYEVVRVDPDESYAANCVRTNAAILIAAGYPRLERKLRELGYELDVVDASEFRKMDGGLSCLSLRC
jgi:dimethylargininase